MRQMRRAHPKNRLYRHVWFSVLTAVRMNMVSPTTTSTSTRTAGTGVVVAAAAAAATVVVTDAITSIRRHGGCGHEAVTDPVFQFMQFHEPDSGYDAQQVNEHAWAEPGRSFIGHYRTGNNITPTQFYTTQNFR